MMAGDGKPQGEACINICKVLYSENSLQPWEQISSRDVPTEVCYILNHIILFHDSLLTGSLLNFLNKLVCLFCIIGTVNYNKHLSLAMILDIIYVQ